MGSAGQLVALLSQNVSLPPPGQQHQGPGRPCPYGEPAQLGERSITFAFKAFQLEKKKSNNKYQSKGFLPFEGPNLPRAEQGPQSSRAGARALSLRDFAEAE